MAELNGDGAADPAVADSETGSAHLERLYQDPTQRGSFRPSMVWTVRGTATTGVPAGDLDGDGLADLAMTVALPKDGSILNCVTAIGQQQPDGTTGSVATSAPQNGLNVTRMTLADSDGDGMNDVFTCFTPSSAEYEPKPTVLLQDPVRGHFAAPVESSMHGLKGIDDAVLAGLDGDRRPDAAVAGPTRQARLRSFTRGSTASRNRAPAPSRWIRARPCRSTRGT